MGTLNEHLLQYLERARVDELSDDLRSKGYKLTPNATVGAFQVSLLAEKPGQRLAYEVVASDQLQEMSEAIAAKRNAVLTSGINRFLISVVSLPKTTEVDIYGLPEAIRAELETPTLHSDLATIGQDTKLLSVREPEYDSVAIDSFKLRVVGSALASITFIEPGFGMGDDEVTADVPFDFDIVFAYAPDFKVKTVHHLAIDASEFDS